MSSEREEIIRETTAFSLALYLFQLISVLRGFVIAWFLGPALYGVWNIFKIFLDTGNYVAAGSSQAVTRELPFNKAQGLDQQNQLISQSTIALIFWVSMIIAMLVLAFSFMDIAAAYSTPIRIGAFAFVLNAIHLHVPNQLQGEKKIFLLAIYYIGYATLNAVFGLLLMMVWGISGLLLGMIAANLVLIAWLLHRQHLPIAFTPRWNINRSLIAIGFPILFVTVAPKLMASLDKIIIFWLLDSTATGFYSMAAFFSEAINYIPLSLAAVLFPRLMYQKGKGADLSQMTFIYEKPMVLLSLLIPILLGLLILTIGIVIRYLLPEYLPAVPVLQVLLAGLFFTVIWSVPKTLLVVFNKQRIFIVAVPLLLLLGSLMNIAVIKLGYGITGVAYASVVFYSMVSTLTNIYALRILQKNSRQIAITLVQIHLPFVYAMTGVVLLQHFLNNDNELLQSLLRSIVFMLLCLPLVVYADRKLQLFNSLRTALFNSGNRS